MTPLVRPATEADIGTMSKVLTESITQLCAADHGNDPDTIASWTANKTPDGVAAMLAQPGLFLFVAELDGQVAAVGATTANGEIALNYVAPQARYRGLSTALLAHMEADLRTRGFAQGRLKATRTAHQFYLQRGWSGGATTQDGRFIDCFVMHKPL